MAAITNKEREETRTEKGLQEYRSCVSLSNSAQNIKQVLSCRYRYHESVTCLALRTTWAEDLFCSYSGPSGDIAS